MPEETIEIGGKPFVACGMFCHAVTCLNNAPGCRFGFARIDVQRCPCRTLERVVDEFGGQTRAPCGFISIREAPMAVSCNSVAVYSTKREAMRLQIDLEQLSGAAFCLASE